MVSGLSMLRVLQHCTWTAEWYLRWIIASLSCMVLGLLHCTSVIFTSTRLVYPSTTTLPPTCLRSLLFLQHLRVICAAPLTERTSTSLKHNCHFIADSLVSSIISLTADIPGVIITFSFVQWFSRNASELFHVCSLQLVSVYFVFPYYRNALSVRHKCYYYYYY